MPGASPQPNVEATKGWTDFSLAFWGLALLTGVGTGLAAGLLMKLLRLVQHLAWSYQGGPYVEAVENASGMTRVLVLACAGLLVAVALPLMARVPSSGPGEVEATIWFRDGRLPPLKTVLKAILSIVVVGLGASLGREAAPKQAGALIGGLAAQWGALTASKRRLLAACGAGAGIAAVYNVPFGGALFALEVLLGSLALPLVAPAFLTTLAATATAWLLLPNEPTYAVPAMPLSAGLVVWAVLFAPIAGGAAALFVKATASVAALKPKGLAIPPVAIAVFVVLGALAIPYPQLLGNGKDMVALAVVGKIALPTLFALMLLKPLVTIACLGTGAPGGLFTPTIAFGAMLGGVCGSLWLAIWPDASIGAFVLIGAGAVLAATTKGPVSALVLMMELTHSLETMMIPMLLAIGGAVSVAHWLDPRSTYTSRLGGAATFHLDADTPVVSAATSYADLLHVLLRLGRPVAVVDETGATIGDLSRADLDEASAQLRPLEIATAVDVLETKA